MERELTLRIILQKPTAGVDFGVQRGRGAGYETIRKQRSTGTDLDFEFKVGVTTDGKGMTPDFRGPVVQGPRGQRFVYIDIGTHAGQTDTPWSRRLKIPLTGITWDLIDRAPAKGLQTQVPGTGRDGGPNCGTVKPFSGWKGGGRY